MLLTDAPLPLCPCNITWRRRYLKSSERFVHGATSLGTNIVGEWASSSGGLDLQWQGKLMPVLEIENQQKDPPQPLHYFSRSTLQYDIQKWCICSIESPTRCTCIYMYSLFLYIFALHVSGAICIHPQEHKLQRTAIGMCNGYVNPLTPNDL
jgi:hypothetical protein